jgi:hypothetical protein
MLAMGYVKLNHIYPKYLKNTRVIPLFKGRDKNNGHEYELISLNSAMYKLLEKPENTRTSDFLENR